MCLARCALEPGGVHVAGYMYIDSDWVQLCKYKWSGFFSNEVTQMEHFPSV